MSITLTAFPTAFLISPEKAKNISLSQVFSEKQSNKKQKPLVSNLSLLRSVRVVTTMRMNEIHHYMPIFDDVIRTGEYSYKLKNGLNVDWVYKDDHCCAVLSGKQAHKLIQKHGEDFFKTLEKVKNYNIRDINSEEFFYYNYETAYTSFEQIAQALESQGATYIHQSPDEIRAIYNNQKIRYYFDKTTQKFMLEQEQKISLVNIGIDNSMISNLVIKTNIKQEELEELLRNFGYTYNEITSETPLKMSSNIIKWELNDGMYSAHIKNIKPTHISGEIEHLFVAMNQKAGRDLRLIENKASFTYTYKTNYTDKGILINTLTEHGAKNVTESDGKIKCELFGMEMTYSKENEQEAYSLVIERVTDKSECEGLLSDINDEYGLNIQEMTYKKILERIDSENMKLEKEEVLDDNSIVLTIEI